MKTTREMLDEGQARYGQKTNARLNPADDKFAMDARNDIARIQSKLKAYSGSDPLMKKNIKMALDHLEVALSSIERY